MPITNGTASSDPGVVALVNVRGDTYCTASIIAPHTAITAAHCIASTDPLSVRVFDGSYHAVVDARLHPGFDPGGRDVAMLRLREPSTVTPLALADIDPADAGSQLRIVGFGLSGPDAGDAGTQRAGTAQLAAVRDEEIVLVPEPSLSCLGDSGGPALLDGAIVGVVSRTDSRCEDHAVYSRVDVAREILVDPFLAEEPELEDGSCSVATGESSWVIAVALLVSLRRCGRRRPGVTGAAR